MQRYRTFGDYVLLRKIATGGMAEVHLALKRGPATFDRLVALKMILSHHTESDTLVSMFYNEARLGARFNHPNLINVYDVQVVEDTLTMVMEYVPGATVAELVTRSTDRGIEFRRPMGIRLVLDSCLGLYHAHHLRDLDGTPLTVVHRDVSPQNILVGYSGQVKVFDFGIAHTSGGNGESEQLSGVLAGKYAYMSPEQCHGGELDERSDVFSLGILLWELTTQKRLFRRRNQIEVLRAITEESIPYPSSVVESYPKGLERVVMAALERDPGNRPATALNLHDELLKYAALADEQLSSTSLGGFMEEVFTDELQSEWASLSLALQQIEEKEMTGPRVRPDKEAASPAPYESEEAVADGEIDGDMALEALALRTMGEADHSTPAVTGLHSPLELSLTDALRRSRRLAAVLAVGLFLALAAASTGALLLATGRTAESTAPAVTRNTSQIAIASDPPGAVIFLDGVQRAEVTPAVLEAPLDRQLNVRLSLEGYHDAQVSVTASPEAPYQNLGVTLLAAVDRVERGTIRIVASPPDSQVHLNGTLRGRGTPLTVSDLALGAEHTLRVERAGFEPRELSFELTSAATREMRVELQQAVDLGRLTVNTEPLGAEVRIDGELAGLTPLAGVPLVAGRAFAIEVSLEGHRPYRESVLLGTDEERVLDERLERVRPRNENGPTVPEPTPDSPEAVPVEEAPPGQEEIEPEPYELLP